MLTGQIVIYRTELCVIIFELHQFRFGFLFFWDSQYVNKWTGSLIFMNVQFLVQFYRSMYYLFFLLSKTIFVTRLQNNNFNYFITVLADDDVLRIEMFK